jgi:hypothetical protein
VRENLNLPAHEVQGFKTTAASITTLSPTSPRAASTVAATVMSLAFASARG